MKNLLHFNKSLYIRKELLGSTFSFLFFGYNARLLFPNIKTECLESNGLFENDNDKLIKPNDGSKEYIIDINNNEIVWGNVASYPDFCSYLYYIELILDIEIESLSDGDYEKLVETLEKWKDKFYDYCNICTNYYHKNEKCSDKDCKLGIFINGHYYFDRKRYFNLNFCSKEVAITKNQIEEAIKYACSSKDIFLKYRMLSLAKENCGFDNRKAVLDGSTALELCYVEELEKICEIKGINKDIILKNYSSLGKREQLFEIFGQKIDFVDTKEAINLRNKVMHNDSGNTYTPSDKEVGSFINTIEEVLKHFHKSYY